MVPVFESLPGVLRVTSGYAGGHVQHPTYEEVVAGTSGHTEAVQVEYDPAIINYERLLESYWHNIDPTDGEGQFYDRGPQYRLVIFFHDDAQRAAALLSKELMRSRFISVHVSIEPFVNFYEAEEYHQEYHKKNPVRYNLYKRASGREKFLKDMWQ